MQALVWLGDDRLRVDETSDPEPGAGEAVLDVELTGICGSDLHAFRGSGGRRVPPLILGHEAVGRLPGHDQLYVAFPLWGCGHCALCLSGRENLCPERLLLGLDRPGTFAERVAVPSGNLIAVPDGVSAPVAALTEPLATAVGALRNPEPSPGQRVVVIGCGSIGLLSVYAAASGGAEVTAVDPVQTRRRVASTLGSVAVHPSTDDLADGWADLVIDAVGHEATWNAALRISRPGGTVVVVGLGASSGMVPIGDLVRRGIILRGSYAYTRRDFSDALELLSGRPPAVDWLSIRPLGEGRDSFRDLVESPGESVKILLRP
jgi:threonine dehydrogenase-like Zn-dependent dehydrogenase